MVLHHVHHAVGFLNTNTMFSGIMMLLLNVGSRYVTHEFSSNDEEYSQNILLRRIAIFAICFVGTKDLVISLILTAGFVILAGGLFRGKGEQSREGMSNIATAGAVGMISNEDFGKMQDPAPPLFKDKEV
jgi:hypothetical protein